MIKNRVFFYQGGAGYENSGWPGTELHWAARNISLLRGVWGVRPPQIRQRRLLPGLPLAIEVNQRLVLPKRQFREWPHIPQLFFKNPSLRLSAKKEV